MQVLFSIVMALVTLGILVTIHEYGHYWVARRCGVRVLRFAVGFGRPLAMRVDRHGTEFALCAIPLGGYVKMLDERDEGQDVTAENRHESFNAQPVRNKLAIVSAGPAANFLLAILVLFGLFLRGETGIAPVIEAVEPGSVAHDMGLMQGQEIVAVDGTSTQTVSNVRFALLKRLGDTGTIDISVGNALSDLQQTYALPIDRWLGGAEAPDPTRALGLTLGIPPLQPSVGSLVEGGPATRAGFEVDDTIIEADGQAISTWLQWVDLVRASPGRSIAVLVERDGQTIELTVVPRSTGTSDAEVGSVGMGVVIPDVPEDRIRRQGRNPVEALSAAIERTFALTVFTFESMWKMIQGLISTKNLSGPIAIAQVAASTAESGFTTWLSFLALLSISLGAINLLPIPVLDGGHIVFHSLEGLLGRPVPEQIQIMSYQVGLLAVFTLMVFAIYNDVARL
ncbi:MAG: RIP metalloprotease RseP [Pseudomonadota bacterium]|nr:RIP metalloprotease RseP [Pseudomonadota bacterium]MEC9121216.1 RIP metalloprotease RseP [Pseudomonadota bacterium]